jgi:hypothetical protein
MQVITRLFDGKEKELTLYNRQAVIDKDFYFYTVECYNGEDDEEVDFDFPGFSSAYFRVYNERTGRLIKDLAMTRSGAYLILNASVSDMTFDDLGIYYYEIGYVRSVYDQALRYGKLTII